MENQLTVQPAGDELVSLTVLASDQLDLGSGGAAVALKLSLGGGCPHCTSGLATAFQALNFAVNPA